ncbi:arylesterase [Brevundimonas sp. NIBR11]|uniref:arylesterase n=1 Tax=Brevundimonas sp. NIBR11 TaxID=3015999 RepID=UPI0022F00329|nr:arylesterase [Brevundimonas sp. NIBR11]WGM30506.1 Arylesterase [Brevundimonas sp. NIBR11]
MTRPIVTLLGDSISAGYGLRASEALPVRLQAAVAACGVDIKVVGAGVSGDAIRDGLRRLDRSVAKETTLCVVALGANDLMQSIPLERMRADLDAILARLRARSIPVLLCGMRAPPWLGARAQAFDAVFHDAARAHGVALYPFLLEGVALNPMLSLADRIHPNARGIEIIARNLAPHVIAALRPAVADLSQA